MSPLGLPENAASLSPKEVARLVAQDLSLLLPDGTWSVTAAGSRSTQGNQIVDLTLQRSPWSRTGHGVWLYPRLTIRDRDLERWHKEHEDVIGRRPKWLFNSMLVNISAVNTVEVLTNGGASLPAPGLFTYEGFVAHRGVVRVRVRTVPLGHARRRLREGNVEEQRRVPITDKLIAMQK